jgi:2,3-bisphosphoglycerate-dependent phosphoglycerate mutase
MKNFILIFLFVVLGQQSVNAQKAVKVWVVRHAEKLTVDSSDKDPELAEDGKVRAQALAKLLKSEKIDSIFATNYKRTKLTGFPLADIIGITVKTYDPAQIKALAKEWSKNAAGKKLLIIGHSNTVLEIIEAFGGKKPVNELTDEDYDYIFELTVKGDKVEVKTGRYGQEHHSTTSRSK